MENTILTRYKNSRPYCHSSLISAASICSGGKTHPVHSQHCAEVMKALLQRAREPAQKPVLTQDGSWGGTACGTVGQLAGADAPPHLHEGAARDSASLQQGSEVDFHVQVALRGFCVALQEGSPQKSTSWPPSSHRGLGSLQVLRGMMQAFPVLAGLTGVPLGLTATQGKGKPCSSTSSHPCSTILCSENLHRTFHCGTALPQDGPRCPSASCVPLSFSPTSLCMSAPLPHNLRAPLRSTDGSPSHLGVPWRTPGRVCFRPQVHFLAPFSPAATSALCGLPPGPRRMHLGITGQSRALC